MKSWYEIKFFKPRMRWWWVWIVDTAIIGTALYFNYLITDTKNYASWVVVWFNGFGSMCMLL